MNKIERLLQSASLASLILLSLVLPGTAQAMVGKFQFVNGAVSVVDASGLERGVKKGDEINEGDTVATTASGFTQIRMEDGGFIALRPDTRFKIDSYQFNGKDDGSEHSFFSLIKGSLRSVTGLIGKKHRDNYKIQTAVATIGIRGSGADVGHNDAIGTAVRTLFGAHSLSSKVEGKIFTIETHPGQIALVAPGGVPHFVPSFPFSTTTAPAVGNGDKKGDTGGGNGEKNGDAGGGGGGTNAGNATGAGITPYIPPNTITIPITTTTGENLTDNTTGSGATIGATMSLTPGIYGFHSISEFPVAGGYNSVELNTLNFFDPAGNFTFDAAGNITGILVGEFKLNDASQNELAFDIGTNITFNGGVTADAYHTADGSIYIGREQNVTVAYTCYTCLIPSKLTLANIHWGAFALSEPAVVQTMTGTANYALAGATHPTDAQGNVGTLNSASLSANFTNQTASFGVNLTIAGKTLNASASNIPIVGDGFDAQARLGNGNLVMTCSGCGGSPYDGNLGGIFSTNGNAGMGYNFWPVADTRVGGPYTDYITGIVALTSGSSPAVIPSQAGPVGSGGAGAGIFGPIATPTQWASFNTVDQVFFAARLDAAGNLIAFSNNSQGLGFGDSSMALGAATLVNTGSDPALGVMWGRWAGNYIANGNANVNGNYLNAQFTPLGSFHYMTASHITTATELAALPGLGVPTASYSILGGSTSPTNQFGNTATLSSASATVDFTSQQITNYAITVSPAAGWQEGTWTASGSRTIASFIYAGIPLTGSCSGAVTGPCGSTGATIGGTASGGFVGTQAQGMISTFALQNTSNLGMGNASVVGSAYLKR